jgi:hypothetical protein
MPISDAVRKLLSVNKAPAWQLAQFALPVNNAFPLSAAAASKLPAGGFGAIIECW